jgi:hypothetical protein
MWCLPFPLPFHARAGPGNPGRRALPRRRGCSFGGPAGRVSFRAVRAPPGGGGPARLGRQAPRPPRRGPRKETRAPRGQSGGGEEGGGDTFGSFFFLSMRTKALVDTPPGKRRPPHSRLAWCLFHVFFFFLATLRAVVCVCKLLLPFERAGASFTFPFPLKRGYADAEYKPTELPRAAHCLISLLFVHFLKFKVVDVQE